MLRRTDLNLTSSVARVAIFTLALTVAAALVWLGQSGGFETVVLVSVGVVVAVAVLSSLEFGLMALLFVAATDGFIKGLSPGWHTMLLKDFILAACLLRWAWQAVLGYRRESVQTPITVPTVVFAGWVVVHLFNARSGSFLIGLAGLRMWTIWLPTFFLAYDALDSRQKIERMLLFLVFLMIPVSIYGILQYFLGLEHLFELAGGFSVYEHESYVGTTGTETRPPSTFVSTHSFASALTMVLLMLIGAVIYFKRSRVLQLALLVSMPVMGVALLVTAVRNAVGSAVLGVFTLLVVERRVGLLLIILIVGGIAVYQVDAMTGGEATNRISSIVEDPEYTVRRVVGPWRSAVRHVADYPLGGGIASGMGLGRVARRAGLSAGRFDPEHRVLQPENEYARALVELGIPGFLLFLWLLFTVMRNTFLAYRAARERRDQWLLAALFASCFSILARLLTGPALYGWPEAIIFWSYTAMALRLPKIEEAEMRRRQAPSTEARPVELETEELPWARRDAGET